ncbi:MAG TPA: ABC-F family ATP-binding cassette domain-containing protein [Trueperaceae bacterium]
MVLAALQSVDKYYGGQTVLENATLELRPLARTALIGRNGSGKSTILRLLAGLEQADGGQVYVRPQVGLGMLEQDPGGEPGQSVLELCEASFAGLDALEAQLQQLEKLGLDDPETYGRWETLHERFERRGGYERRARRDMVLHALGFRGREGDEAHVLSGGEKTRLGLARLLMTQPDVLLLDEPTNHLDMEMRGWLEGYLSRYPGAALIVSHDRAFLDGACSATAEISLGVLRTHDGNPSSYRAARAEQERIEAATRANERRELERLESAARQMKQWAGQNEKLHRRAKAMEKRVERFESGMLEDAPPGERTTRFRFDAGLSGEIVLQASHLSKSFGKDLFEDVDVTVRKGERIALLGPNGAGKTTFLRILLGEEPSDDPRGRVVFGSRVRVGYYDQELAGVDPQKTLIEEMIRLVGDTEAHNLLGNFLFPFDAQYKRIADLSGGERARLALLKLTLANCNLLVLDEPTNHLDVEMIEALEAALVQFEGTVLLVSHDRRFVSQTANLIWELADGSFEQYEGDLEFYLRKRDERRQPRAVTEEAEHTRSSGRTPGPSRWKLERKLEELERRVTGLEERIAELDETLARPDSLSAGEIAEAGRRHQELEEELIEAMASWEETQEALGERLAERG